MQEFLDQDLQNGHALISSVFSCIKIVFSVQNFFLSISPDLTSKYSEGRISHSCDVEGWEVLMHFLVCYCSRLDEAQVESRLPGEISITSDMQMTPLLWQKVRVKSLSRVWLFATPWTVAYNAPPSMGFSRQEYWSGLPFHLQRIFLTQGSNPGLLHCRQTLYRLSHQGSLCQEELKSLLMKVKEESEKAGLKHNIQKTKNMASGPITS